MQSASAFIIFMFSIVHDMFFCSGVYSPDYDNCSNAQYVNKQPKRLRKGDFGSDRDHWTLGRINPKSLGPPRTNALGHIPLNNWDLGRRPNWGLFCFTVHTCVNSA